MPKTKVVITSGKWILDIACAGCGILAHFEGDALAQFRELLGRSPILCPDCESKKSPRPKGDAA